MTKDRRKRGRGWPIFKEKLNGQVKCLSTVEQHSVLFLRDKVHVTEEYMTNIETLKQLAIYLQRSLFLNLRWPDLAKFRHFGKIL